MNRLGFTSWYGRNTACQPPDDTYATLPFLISLFKRRSTPIWEIAIASKTLSAGEKKAALTPINRRYYGRKQTQWQVIASSPLNLRGHRGREIQTAFCQNKLDEFRVGKREGCNP
jgi:hypothetical protein